MSLEKFRDLESKYNELKEKAAAGQIDSATVNKELKKLMVMDDRGNYWIIGGNSGKWYRYDGKDWKVDDPFKTEEKAPEKESESINTTQIIKNKVDVVETETKTAVDEQEPDHQTQASEEKVLCKYCKSKIDPTAIFCHICGGNQKESVEKPPQAQPVQSNASIIPEMLVASVNIVSLLFFIGGIGLIFGVLTGATIGVFKDIPLFFELPQFLGDQRSNILGGIIFAILGGIAGFILFAIKALFIGAFYNIISYFFGGIRFKTKR